MAPYVGAPEIKARRLVLTVEYHGQIGNPGFNDSTPLNYNLNYGAPVGGGADWLRPQLIIPGRLAKFAFQIDF